MARIAAAPTRVESATQTTGHDLTLAPTDGANDKVLPLPNWLKKDYFIFPVILYIPDVLFNYYVYSDGGTTHTGGVVAQVFFAVLWGFLSIGVVGMAYLLSVLAPWHWGQGHRMQAFFCGLGVLIATGITTWNSLAYRSQHFQTFQTDQWLYNIWPQLKAMNFSVTMVLVAIAPPFWGLFWAMVQPTETGRTLRQIQESHQERLLRMKQESELKALRAESNARVRAAQLKGMAATAAAARDQAKGLLTRRADEPDAQVADGQTLAELSAGEQRDQSTNEDDAGKVLQMPTFVPSREQGGRGGAVLFNHAPSAGPGVRSAPATGIVASLAQPSLLGAADVFGPQGMPSADAAGFTSGMMDDLDGATGTTGPRPKIQPGLLTRSMNEPSPEHRRIVVQALQEYGLRPGKSGLTAKQMEVVAPIVAERVNVDGSSARSLIKKVMQFESQRAARQ
ncbi:MAG: hypothetical protein ACHQ4H_00395 [Ktedonobacterales bacterium]